MLQRSHKFDVFETLDFKSKKQITPKFSLSALNWVILRNHKNLAAKKSNSGTLTLALIICEVCLLLFRTTATTLAYSQIMPSKNAAKQLDTPAAGALSHL